MESKKLTPDQVRQAEAMLARIPGVASCRIRADASGEIHDVHVVATAEKPAAAVAREVETWLRTQLGVQVDPGQIAVVVPEAGAAPAGTDLEEFPILEHSSRFAFGSVNVTSSRDGSRVEVELTRDSSSAFGVSVSDNVLAPPRMAIAEATLRAVAEFLDDAIRLCLSGVVKVPLGDEEAVLVRVDVILPRCTKSLAGCALVGNDENQSVVFATLDAVNRMVGKLDFKTSVEYKIQ